MYWSLWQLEGEKTFFNPSSNFWENAARSSGVLNLECFNFSGCGLSDQPRSVSEVSERALDYCCCPRCNELSALNQA